MEHSELPLHLQTQDDCRGRRISARQAKRKKAGAFSRCPCCSDNQLPQHKRQRGATAAEPPQKRRRTSGAPPTEPPAEPPQKRRRTSGAPPTEPSAEPPKKRRRTSGAPPTEPSAEPPKKRRRTSGAPPTEPSAEPPKKRRRTSGAPPTKTPAEPPQKRRRTSGAPPTEPPAEPPQKRRRTSGAPPTEPPAEPPQKRRQTSGAPPTEPPAEPRPEFNPHNTADLPQVLNLAPRPRSTVPDVAPGPWPSTAPLHHEEPLKIHNMSVEEYQRIYHEVVDDMLKDEQGHCRPYSLQLGRLIKQKLWERLNHPTVASSVSEDGREQVDVSFGVGLLPPQYKLDIWTPPKPTKNPNKKRNHH